MPPRVTGVPDRLARKPPVRLQQCRCSGRSDPPTRQHANTAQSHINRCNRKVRAPRLTHGAKHNNECSADMSRNSALSCLLPCKMSRLAFRYFVAILKLQYIEVQNQLKIWRPDPENVTFLCNLKFRKFLRVWHFKKIIFFNCFYVFFSYIFRPPFIQLLVN